MLQPSREFHLIRQRLCSRCFNPRLSRVEGPERAPGDYFPPSPGLILPVFLHHSPPSELKQRLCSPHEGTRREVMGKLFHRGPCAPCFLSHLQCRGAGAQERCRIRSKSERAGRRLFSAFRGEFKTSFLEATSTLIFFRGAYKEGRRC